MVETVIRMLMNSAYEGEQDQTQVISPRMRMVTRSLNNKTLALTAFVVSVFHEEYPTSRSSRSCHI